VNEIGIRQPSFRAFLEFVLDVGSQDVADLSEAKLARTA
jgi:hypothetical protein